MSRQIEGAQRRRGNSTSASTCSSTTTSPTSSASRSATPRRELLEGKGQKDYILKIAGDLLDYLLDEHCGKNADPKDWTIPELKQAVRHNFGVDTSTIDFEHLGMAEMRETCWRKVIERYEAKERTLGDALMRDHERMLMLQIIDQQWKDHLYAMDHLKEGINLRAYGQKDPLIEYKRESFEMFERMRERIEDDIIRYLWLLEVQLREEPPEAQRQKAQKNLSYSGPAEASADGRKPVKKKGDEKVGRNAPCPCGSGKKYKVCHGGG
ncbi:MAG: SEC-C metal-binding domain-containing protein [Acidobacteriota bacterium]